MYDNDHNYDVNHFNNIVNCLTNSGTLQQLYDMNMCAPPSKCAVGNGAAGTCLGVKVVCVGGGKRKMKQTGGGKFSDFKDKLKCLFRCKDIRIVPIVPQNNMNVPTIRIPQDTIDISGSITPLSETTVMKFNFVPVLQPDGSVGTGSYEVSTTRNVCTEYLNNVQKSFTLYERTVNRHQQVLIDKSFEFMVQNDMLIYLQFEIPNKEACLYILKIGDQYYWNLTEPNVKFDNNMLFINDNNPESKVYKLYTFERKGIEKGTITIQKDSDNIHIVIKHEPILSDKFKNITIPCTLPLDPPEETSKDGGGQYTTLLGRRRRVVQDGKKKYVNIKGERVALGQAIKMDKAYQKQKALKK
jgi:hypothetical protein